jgi:hypothetical protein
MIVTRSEIAKLGITLVLLIGILSCSEELVPRYDGSITLAISELNPYSVKLRVYGSIDHLPSILSLRRVDGFPSTDVSLTKIEVDTIIRDANLLPKHDYTFRAFVLSEGSIVDSSIDLTLTTPDTSSHGFHWTLFHVGFLGSQATGVSIVNDSCAWISGNFQDYESNDSTQVIPYGALTWNGTDLVKRIVRYLEPGSSTLYPGELTGIQAIAENDVYATTAMSLLHWDGYDWGQRAMFYQTFPFNYALRSLWIENAHQIYCGGRNGGLFLVRDSNWTDLSPGGNMTFVDLWGTTDPSTHEPYVLGAMSRPRVDNTHALIKIVGESVSALSDSGIQSPILSVWKLENSRAYIANWDIVTKPDPLAGGPWSRTFLIFVPWAYPQSIRGNNENDLLLGCADGEVIHYNGASALSYSEVRLTTGQYQKVALRGNLAVAVGEEQGRAVVAIGTRR